MYIETVANTHLKTPTARIRECYGKQKCVSVHSKRIGNQNKSEKRNVKNDLYHRGIVIIARQTSFSYICRVLLYGFVNVYITKDMQMMMKKLCMSNIDIKFVEKRKLRDNKSSVDKSSS